MASERLHIPEELIERLDRYLDRAETLTGLTSNRSDAIRQALSYWLDAREATLLNR